MSKPFLYRFLTILCLLCSYSLILGHTSNKGEKETLLTKNEHQPKADSQTPETTGKTAEELYELGKKYYLDQNIEAALVVLLQCLESIPEKEFPELRARANQKLSSIYQELGAFDLAYSYQLQSLELYEVLSDSLGIARALYEVGSIYFFQNRFELALQKYTESKELVEELKDSIGIYSCLGAIGSVHNRLGNINKSLYLNLEALRLAEEMNYKEGIAYAMHNIGADYYDLKYYNKALTYYEQALEYKKEIGDKFDEIATLQSLGAVYLDISQTNKALSYFKEALKIAENIHAKSRKAELYQWLSDAYEKQNNLKAAFQYMKAHALLQDSILNENTLKEMSQSKTRYEVNKKEKEIALLKKKNELLGKNKEIASWKNYFLIVLAIFLLFTSFLFFYYYKSQKKYSDLLADKNLQIQEQNEQLAEVNDLQASFNETLKTKNEQIKFQNEQLANSNKELKQFAYIASHDLKEPLRMIGAYTSLLQRRYSKKLDEGAQEFMGFITDATRRMNNLLEDLLTYSKVGTQELQKEPVKMCEVVEASLANLQLKIKQKHAKVNLSDLPEVEVSRIQMGQLYQNLISNAIKFSDKNEPEIWIDAEKRGRFHVFSVRDNGIGIADEHKERIFEMFSRLHTRQEYEGTGIGLATCKKIVEQHCGRIWVESEKDKGSTFYFSIPTPVFLQKTSPEERRLPYGQRAVSRIG